MNTQLDGGMVLEGSKERLMYKAWHALHVRNVPMGSFVVFYVDRTSSWNEFAERVLGAPSQTRNERRALGRGNAYLGTASVSLCDILIEEYDDRLPEEIKEALQEKSPEGRVKAIILSGRYITITDIEPKPMEQVFN